ncbi:hypothetical protein FRX31_006378 [Thalictrum thalictroides]|uniref:Uncharacterized protein n=1 Tax=Thalictrum thalictroides TaxID=46969 RepID=A0A7J6X2Z1_THATH|nr:hypothetical protein FRX31_006378 [Thalictrum thalictroides]
MEDYDFFLDCKSEPPYSDEKGKSKVAKKAISAGSRVEGQNYQGESTSVGIEVISKGVVSNSVLEINGGVSVGFVKHDKNDNELLDSGTTKEKEGVNQNTYIDESMSLLEAIKSGDTKVATTAWVNKVAFCVGPLIGVPERVDDTLGEADLLKLALGKQVTSKV